MRADPGYPFVMYCGGRAWAGWRSCACPAGDEHESAVGLRDTGWWPGMLRFRDGCAGLSVW